MSATANQLQRNPHCPECNGQGQPHCISKNGKQVYRCKQCRRHFRLVYSRGINNPPCPGCQGKTQRRGTHNGSPRLFCSECRRYCHQDMDGVVTPTRCRNLAANPPCPICQAVTRKFGFQSNGARIYGCKSCCRYFVVNGQRQQQLQSNPRCTCCGGTSQKRGLSRGGNFIYKCRECGKRLSLTRQQQQQHEAQGQAEQLPFLVDEKLPKNLPVEIREELQQELIVAALAGEFALSELDQAVLQYRRKVNRQSLTGFGYVSLDAVIPHTEGLTYADTLAG